MLGLLLLTSPVLAQGSDAQAPQATPRRTDKAPVKKKPGRTRRGAPPRGEDAPRAPAAAPSADALDFDLLEPAAPAPLPDPALERSIKRRRTLLTLHQVGGIAMAAGLVGTTVVGQLNFHDRYRGGGDSGRWRGLHKGLAYGTAGTFVAVGALGLFAPEPFDKGPLRLDTATLHKLFMGTATAGMVAQVVLGIVAKSQEGKLSQVNLATAHQVTGYATLTAVSLGVLMLTF